jgi:hypothetical protein
MKKNAYFINIMSSFRAITKEVDKIDIDMVMQFFTGNTINSYTNYVYNSREFYL